MMRKTLFVLLVLLIAALMVAPVFAQDATDVVPTVQPTEIVPPVVVVPPVVAADPTPNYGQIATLITAFLVVGGIVYFAIKSAAAGVPLEQIDKQAAERTENIRKDREMMQRLEAAYQSQQQTFKLAIDTLANVITVVTPFLQKYQLDDAIGDVLSDIKTPGADVPPGSMTSSSAAQG